jgi:DNA-binding IclR family transcriptional regulator
MSSTCYLSELDGSQKTYLDEDPAIYQDVPPERRASSHATADGRVWQDFGAPDVDRQIKLRTDWMSQATLDSFADKFAQVGHAWRWVDNRGHEYHVFFRSLTSEYIRGQGAYRVEMIFDVLQVVA